MSNQSHVDVQNKQRPTTRGGLTGTGMRIGIVCSRWNKTVIDSLVKGCREELQRLKVRTDDIVTVQVPGSYELPMGAKRMIDMHHLEKKPLDAVIAIGCLIKGETMHFEYIAEAVTQGIMKLSLDSGIPVIFGVLACLTEEQATLRAGIDVGEKKGHNHGIDWGNAAVEMASLYRKTSISELYDKR
eukprot:g1147.t1